MLLSGLVDVFPVVDETDGYSALAFRKSIKNAIVADAIPVITAELPREGFVLQRIENYL